MAPLDGKEPVKPVPFDAHEQAQQQAAADYEHQEYPKAVDHVEHPSGVGLQPIVVKSAEEEKAYQAAKADEQPEPAKAE
jgi:hypothetical protein